MVGIDDVLIGIGVTALVTWVTGCSDTPEELPLVPIDSDPPAWQGDGGAEAPDAATRGPDAATPSADTTGVAVDVTIAQDTYTVPDTPPTLPFAGTVTWRAESPCGTNGFITDLDEEGWGTCTALDGASHLFRLSAGTDGAVIVDSALHINRILEQLTVVPKTTNHPEVTYFSGVDPQLDVYGYFVYGEDVTGSNWHMFPDAEVNGTTFRPNFAKGIAVLDNTLFIATSNVVFDEQLNAHYHPGLVERCDLTKGTCVGLPTSGVNPTSVGIVPVNGVPRIAVVNTGSATFDLIDPADLDGDAIQSFSLPESGLGLHGEIPVAGGRLAIGSGNDTGHIIVMPVDGIGQSYTMLTMPGSNDGGFHLLSLIKLAPDGNYLVAGDYNTGTIATWKMGDTEGPQSIGAVILVDKDLSDTAGISDGIWWNGALLVAVGNQLWEVR